MTTIDNICKLCLIAKFCRYKHIYYLCHAYMIISLYHHKNTFVPLSCHSRWFRNNVTKVLVSHQHEAEKVIKCQVYLLTCIDKVLKPGKKWFDIFTMELIHNHKFNKEQYQLNICITWYTICIRWVSSGRTIIDCK